MKQQKDIDNIIFSTTYLLSQNHKISLDFTVLNVLFSLNYENNTLE